MEIKWTKYMKVDPELRSLWLNIWPYPRHTRVASIVSRSLSADDLMSQRSAGELLQTFQLYRLAYVLYGAYASIDWVDVTESLEDPLDASSIYIS